MAGPDKTLADDLADALAAWAKSFPGGTANFVLLLVPPDGKANVVANIGRAAVLELLQAYLEHCRGQDEGSRH